MTVFANFIGGSWRTGDAALSDVNPADTRDIIGDYAVASAADTADAVSAAREALRVDRTSIQARCDALDRIGSEILVRRDELGALLTREEGKTIPEGVAEATRAGQIFKFFAGEAIRQSGDILDSVRPNVGVEVTREPRGVVALITPWNFPLAIPAWKIAPALAFGNAVVFKPADIVPACAWTLSEIISRSGLPAGMFNLVMGGAEAGAALITQNVDAVSFTGSRAIGRQIFEAIADRMIPVQLEMGGKNPLVVLDDADVDIAVTCAIQGAYHSTGQRCTASSRLIVTKNIHDHFVDKLHRAAAALVVGDPFDAATQIGPVASNAQLVKNQSYLDIATREGAELLFGGERLERKTPGFYQSPVLWASTTSDMRINTEEIFGPTAAVIRVEDADEALHVANATPFGLSAGVCTQSLAAAAHFKRRLEAGMVMVNLPTAGVDYHVPFGGRKQSSFGPREQGRYAREFYTTVKTAYISA